MKLFQQLPSSNQMPFKLWDQGIKIEDEKTSIPSPSYSLQKIRNIIIQHPEGPKFDYTSTTLKLGDHISFKDNSITSQANFIKIFSQNYNQYRANQLTQQLPNYKRGEEDQKNSEETRDLKSNESSKQNIKKKEGGGKKVSESSQNVPKLLFYHFLAYMRKNKDIFEQFKEIITNFQREGREKSHSDNFKVAHFRAAFLKMDDTHLTTPQFVLKDQYIHDFIWQTRGLDEINKIKASLFEIFQNYVHSNIDMLKQKFQEEFILIILHGSEEMNTGKRMESFNFQRNMKILL